MTNLLDNNNGKVAPAKNTRSVNFSSLIALICFVILCLVLLYCTYYLLKDDLKGSGWDFKTYCAATKAYGDGKDPYYSKNIYDYIKEDISYIYPPLALLFFKPFCYTSPRLTYFIAWTLLLIASMIILSKADIINRKSDWINDWILLITIFCSGFLAVYWNYITGNIGIIELFLFSIAVYMIKKGRNIHASLALCVSSFLKLTPIFFTLIFLLKKDKVVNIVKYLLAGVVGLIILSAISLAIYPDISHSYYMSMTGKIEGQHSPFTEGGGSSNPSSKFFIAHLLNIIGADSNALNIGMRIVFAAIVFSLLIYLAYLYRNDFFKIFLVATLAILLVLPRLKPYSFTYALIPAYFLIKDLSYGKKYIFLSIISALPIILTLIDKYAPSLPSYISLFLMYRQLIALMIFYFSIAIYFIIYAKRNMKIRHASTS